MQFNIIDILYFAFIFPLQFSLGILLDYIFALIKSQGFSIIVLSLLVNIFLLKIFILADKKASKVSAIKARCDSKIAEFKRAFKGAELQSYIRTLYKQRHYHPIFALSSLGGLALQVPFFIAVFCLLQEVKWLENASFLWIEDLSKADSMLGVHILPILMTIITLINVFISSKERGARIQGSLIALIFLVLLYNMPSALVLYWTTNMAFALGRAVIKAIKRDSNANSSLGETFRPFENFEHSQTHSLASRPKFSKDTKAFTANTRIFLNANDRESQGDSAVDSHAFNKLNSHNDEATPHQNTTSSHHKIESDSTHYRSITKLAIMAIGFLVFIFNPFSLYATDINQFDTSKAVLTLCGLVGFCGLFCGGLIYLASFRHINKITAFCACFALLLCLIYSFVLVGDYGAMDNFILQNPAFKDPDLRLQKYINALIAIAVSGIVAFFFLRRFSIACKVASLTMILLTGVNALSVFSQLRLKYSTNLTIAESSANNPPQSTSDSNIQIPPPITLMCHIKTNSLPTTKRKIS